MGGVKGAGELRPGLLLPGDGIRLLDGALAEPRRIVDKDVNPAIGVHRVLDQCPGAAAVPHVPEKQGGLSAVFADLLRCLFGISPEGEILLIPLVCLTGADLILLPGEGLSVVITTLAPSCARYRAMPRPTPWPEPVTTATLPSSAPIWSPLCVDKCHTCIFYSTVDTGSRRRTSAPG